MSWDFDKSTSGEGKKVEFTKFPEGITEIRVIDNEPRIRWQHWLPKINRGINCPGKGCPICEIRKMQKANKEPYTYGMSKRFSMQVLNRNTNKLEIMEQGITFFEDLRDVRESLLDDDKDLINVDLKVKRRGTGKDNTSYRIDVSEEYSLSEEDIKLMEDVLDLKEYYKPATVEQIQRILNGEDFEEVMYKNDEEDVDLK